VEDPPDHEALRALEQPVGLTMARKLIQTTVDAPVCRMLDALAKADGHRRASYLRHLVELHVRALTPELARITKSTSPLDSLSRLTVKPRGRGK
jgi:hypothetical protein